MREKFQQVYIGAAIALLVILLSLSGNLNNMAFCIACFIRDMAGAFNLHSNETLKYLRPEIIGLILGSFITAVLNKEYSPKLGSSIFLRFILGNIVVIGALVFLGCPFRLIIRLGTGDLNAVVGLLGILAGIALGSLFLAKGFSLGRASTVSKALGTIPFIISLLLLTVLVAAPFLLSFSTEGVAAVRAPIIISLIVSLFVASIAYKSRLCMIGGIRDSILLKDYLMLIPFITIIVVLVIFNIFNGTFNLSFTTHAVAHSDHLYNFLGLFIVGLGSVMLGGCPLRQLILAGSGNLDSLFTVFGFFTGSIISMNFGLAGSPKGVMLNGRIACYVLIVLLLIIAKLNMKRK